MTGARGGVVVSAAVMGAGVEPEAETEEDWDGTWLTPDTAISNSMPSGSTCSTSTLWEKLILENERCIAGGRRTADKCA